MTKDSYVDKNSVDEHVTLPAAMVVTPDEYDALPPNSRIELIDGVIHAMAPPNKRHQRVVDQIIWHVRMLCPPQLEAAREQEIRLDDDHRRNPDVVVATAGVTSDDDNGYYPKDVLLAVEVVSPGTRTTDRKHKPVEYADAGIPFYWRVELKPLEVHTYRLGDAGRYETTGVFGLGDTVTVQGLEWAAVKVSELDK